MLFSTLLFYLFSAVLLASSLIVISSKNTVHCVMFLILAFFNAAGLFILLGAEFLAMLLVIVYVGAIAVLFLFVVMMLDIDQGQKFGQIKSKFKEYFNIATLLGLVFFAELFLIIEASVGQEAKTMPKFPIYSDIGNSVAIGNILYTDFFYPFQSAGAILFVAMIGAIVLTLKEQTRFIRKQNISDQVARTKEEAIEVVKVEVGRGLDI